MSRIESVKLFALIDELETSYKLITLGFGELQNFNPTNKFYFLSFQLLSQGFERFMKAYICLGHLHIHETLPTFKYIKDSGHDLEGLLKLIIDNYYFDYKRPQFDIDSKFIKTNSELNELMHILSEFGKVARYYNFDLITGNTKIGINAVERWKEFESKILNSNDIEKLMDESLSPEVYQKISTHIIIVFERYVSALSRQFIFKCLGQQATSLSVSNFFNFGMLYEKKFGITDYRIQTTRYKVEERSNHKRTLNDDIQRKLNPNFKSKKILKSQYEGEWPFYNDEVIIECREKHWCIVTIDGIDYALNGSASRRYKLDTPHQAGMAIIGKSVSDFIKMAFEL